MELRNKFKSIFLFLLILFFLSCNESSDSDGNFADLTEETSAGEKSDVAKVESSKKEMSKDLADIEVDVDVDRPEKQNQQSSGLLTAGEWNDLDNWDFWKALMQNKEWSDKQKHWSFYLTDRVPVIVKNKSGNVLNDVSVSLLSSSGDVLWSAKTDIFGKAVLFAAVFDQQVTGKEIVITDSKGNKTEFNAFKTNEENLFMINDSPELSNNMDIMLVFDATGSMGDELEFLKNEFKDIVEKTESKTPELKIRVGMVFYRDEGDDYVNKNFPFDNNIENVSKNISEQRAGGGGDFPEAVEVGLDEAVNNFSWSEKARTRLMFLILDAPPHHTPGNIEKIQNAVKKAAEKGIKLIPIAASGIDKNTEFLLRFTTIATNGTYVFLTDDSGIGESHLAPTVGKFEVELLNDLILRLIMKYTGTSET